jgi:hypothetical protein
MSRFPRRAVAVLALGALLAGCNDLNSSGLVAPGNPAPATVGEDAEGHELKLADYRGKVVMLSFWSIG